MIKHSLIFVILSSLLVFGNLLYAEPFESAVSDQTDMTMMSHDCCEEDSMALDCGCVSLCAVFLSTKSPLPLIKTLQKITTLKTPMHLAQSSDTPYRPPIS